MHKVAIISLLPVSATGGGESYTFNCAISVSLTGVECDLISPRESFFFNDSSSERFSRLFNNSSFINGKLSTISEKSFGQVLEELNTYQYVWIHQHLASSSVYDILTTARQEQVVLFTNLGFEKNSNDFWIRYEKVPNHFFIEISQYSAKLTRSYTSNVSYAYAGIWQEDLEKAQNMVHSKKDSFVSVNRVLPHKAIEVTIDALSEKDSLIVVGPSDLDPTYEKFLDLKAKGKKVDRIGAVISDVRDSIISNSIALIASSASSTYKSQSFKQSELLGLVILEAIQNNTIAITSSQPALEEVMSLLNLESFVYTERSSKDLRSKMQLVRSLPSSKYDEIIEQAKDILQQKFLWDDYWLRVKQLVLKELKLHIKE
jgi:glycosyltransferase involved in cell wall biosynthesis